MIWVIIVLVAVLSSFALQFLLANKKSKWLGLILPSVFFVATTAFLIMNLTDAFLFVEDYGLFLVEYGNAGLWAMILKVGFIYAPFGIHLILYFIRRHYYKKRNGPARDNKEFRKMIVDDLD